MVKGGFLGEVARYYADDYIVWKYLSVDPDRILKTVKSETDLLVQRYVFLQSYGASSVKKSSIFFGLRGFIEVHKYTLGEKPEKSIKDIAYLSNVALKTAKMA